MGLQLIKSNYFYKGKDGFDKIMLITKNEKGEKDFTIVQKPILEYYISNEKADPETEYRSIPLDMVEKRRCYYKDLYSDMINAVNDPNLTEYYKNVISNPTKGINDKLRKIHLDYRFHGSDVNIEDYYIGKFLEKHPTEKNDYGVTKFFYDIEVDGSSITGFPEAEIAEVPINIISACMDMGDHINFYMLALHYTEEENPSYHEFFNDLVNRVTPIKKEMSEKAGKEVKFIIKRFRNEINLIKEFFNIINDLRPDFVLGWNSHRFDFPYIYNRTSLLIAGTDETIEDIMCPKELPYKKVSYKIDRHKQDACDNASTVNVASYSVHIDQMNLYANLRKGKGQLEKYELDYIAEIELNEHKEELETNIKTQHFDNYTNFFKYSAQDTLLLYLIEKKVEDIEMLYVISMITETRPEQCLKKTVCLRNLASKFYLKNGRAISNNRSSLKQKTGKPRGALTSTWRSLNPLNCWKNLRAYKTTA